MGWTGRAPTVAVDVAVEAGKAFVVSCVAHVTVCRTCLAIVVRVNVPPRAHGGIAVVVALFDTVKHLINWTTDALVVFKAVVLRAIQTDGT